MIEKLFLAMGRFHPLTEEMKERLRDITQIREYPKKTSLLKEGQTSHYACFVFEGLARAYYMIDGREITSRFMDEGFMITSWSSFYTRTPGYEYIETLEESVLGCMHFNDLEQLFKDIPDFNIIGRKLTEYYFYLSEQRTQMLRKHTAEEKYSFFVQLHPDLLQKVPLKYIATYLGMNEETLSRVRSKAARSKSSH